MTNPKAIVVSLSTLAAVLGGCSSASHKNSAAPADAGSGALGAWDGVVPEDATTFTMSPFTVAASSEAFKCTYVQMPASGGFVIGGEHEYTTGSHHLLLYRTGLTSMPQGQGFPAVGDCYAPDATYMDTLTGVVYPAATPSGDIRMPEGVGLPYTPNEILLFQVHYLNATAAPLNPTVKVHLDVTTQPVKQNAGVLFFYDPFIYVPQGGPGTASLRCPIPNDITVFTEASHYHSRGVNYQAYLDEPSPAAPATTPFYTSADWESPTIQLDTMQIKAGSDIRFYCDYNNEQGTQAYIQGQSAAVNEMCMFIGMYYPAMGMAEEQCFAGDNFGTGTQSCMPSLSCLQACPPNDEDAGSVSGELGLVNYNSCIQGCMVNSCAAADDPLIGFLGCLQGPCSTACGGSSTMSMASSAEDAGAGGEDGGVSSACTSCVVSNCLSQYEACSSNTCPASGAN